MSENLISFLVIKTEENAIIINVCKLLINMLCLLMKTK